MMSQRVAQRRFEKLVEDISKMYQNLRSGQISFIRALGRRIVEEEQNGAMRAVYGAQLIPKLAKVLTQRHGHGFSDAVLKRARLFYKAHPISSPSNLLDWSDYVELMPIRDEKLRKRLEDRILKENLNSKEIRRIVLNIRQGTSQPIEEKLPPLKRPGDLRLNTFARSPVTGECEEDEVLIDCGFFANVPVPKSKLKDHIITETPSYTYAAKVERVIDGDTLLVIIRSGLKVILRDRLRLRGIDTPELGTPEGEAAKRYVMKLLPAGAILVLKSNKSKTDTHGRFVVDVFYLQDEKDPERIIKEGTYLNQHLLDEGYAVRMKE